MYNFVLLIVRLQMAKPIKITPVLKGQDALNFHRSVRYSDTVRVRKDVLLGIREDANKLKALFKHKR